MSRCVLQFMTRSEITHAIHAALRSSNRSLTLVGLRALPFAWELRLEDADGVEQVTDTASGQHGEHRAGNLGGFQLALEPLGGSPSGVG